MFMCDHTKLRLSFNEFHNIEIEDMPQYGEFCLLELKDGRYTAGKWNPYDYKDETSVSGEFIRGTADVVDVGEVSKWHSLDRYDLTNCLEDEEIGVINLGAPGDNIYNIEFSEFKLLNNGELPKSEQYCLLILADGGLAAGRWDQWPGGKEGCFIYAPALASYNMKAVWAWTALSDDDFFDSEAESERESHNEEESNRNSSVDQNEFKDATDINNVKEYNPEVKFKFGMDIEVYLDKAYENVKKEYKWLDKNMIGESWHYDIKPVDGVPEFVRINDGNDDIIVCDYDSSEKFIERVEYDYKDVALRANPVVADYSVPFDYVEIHGWNLERYVFSKLQTGDYKVNVTAGNRVTGGSREFFITPYCFDAESYDEFLDRYQDIVPGSAFGLTKEDLISDNELKQFLGY